MDGLTISTTDSLLRGSTGVGGVGGTKNSNSIATPASQPGEKSFADTLKDAVQSVNSQQIESDVKMQQMAVGKNQDVADVMITAEKADISLKLMTTVRNKIIDAYHEIMKMQV